MITYITFILLALSILIITASFLLKDRMNQEPSKRFYVLGRSGFGMFGASLLLLGISFYRNSWPIATIFGPLFFVLGAQIALWAVGISAELFNNVPATASVTPEQSDLNMSEESTEPTRPGQEPAQDQSHKEPRDASNRALVTLGQIISIGLLVVGVSSLQSSGVAQFVSFLSAGLMISGAALLTGGLLGFLFGIPRAFQQGRPVETTLGPEEQGHPGSMDGGFDYRVNTNLEQISDWLTKILVGVGLTQITVIPTKLQQLAAGIAGSLPGNNPTFALTLVLFFLICGFLFCYLWTRLFLPGAFQQADLDALATKVERNKKQLEQIGRKADYATITAKDAQTIAVGTGKSPSEADDRKAISKENIAPGKVPGDPWKGQFGGRNVANNRQLSAKVSRVPGSSDLFSIQLTVSSTDQQQYPLKGAVQFFLHPTFHNDRPVVSVDSNGNAELNLTAWGAFTVGAIADNGATRLELDLSELKDAPFDFRNR